MVGNHPSRKSNWTFEGGLRPLAPWIRLCCLMRPRNSFHAVRRIANRVSNGKRKVSSAKRPNYLNGKNAEKRQLQEQNSQLQEEKRDNCRSKKRKRDNCRSKTHSSSWIGDKGSSLNWGLDKKRRKRTTTAQCDISRAQQESLVNVQCTIFWFGKTCYIILVN